MQLNEIDYGITKIVGQTPFLNGRMQTPAKAFPDDRYHRLRIAGQAPYTLNAIQTQPKRYTDQKRHHGIEHCCHIGICIRD